MTMAGVAVTKEVKASGNHGKEKASTGAHTEKSQLGYPSDQWKGRTPCLKTTLLPPPLNIQKFFLDDSGNG